MGWTTLKSLQGPELTELNQQCPTHWEVSLGQLGTTTSFIPASFSDPLRAVRALCDHTAAGPDQLSFRRGEVLHVITTVDEDWLRCGRDGVEGLVPIGYTSLVL